MNFQIPLKFYSIKSNHLHNRVTQFDIIFASTKRHFVGILLASSEVFASLEMSLADANFLGS